MSSDMIIEIEKCKRRENRKQARQEFAGLIILIGLIAWCCYLIGAPHTLVARGIAAGIIGGVIAVLVVLGRMNE